MTIHHFMIPLLIAVILGSPTVSAQEQASLRFVSLNTEYANLHFVELNDQGEPFLEEKGGMSFVGAGAYWQLPSGLFAELLYRTATDTVDYRGLSQRGTFVETQTELHIQDVNFLLGRNFGRTAAFLGIGSYYRERNILGVGDIRGLYEELEHTNAIFGLRGNLFPTRRFQVRLEARVWTDIDSSFYASSTQSDPTSFTPGKSVSYRTSAEFFFDLVGGLTFSLIPAYEYTQMTKSKEYPLYQNGNPLYMNQYQPKTEWESYSLTGVLRWYF
jgi:hypothetical protein